jgi:hypothetical protein
MVFIELEISGWENLEWISIGVRLDLRILAMGSLEGTSNTF